MQFLALLSALLCAVITVTEAAAPVATPGSRVALNRRHGPSPTGLARRHADYTGHRLSKRAYNGRATWYNVGLGACGWTSSSSEAVVALGQVIWDTKASSDGNINNNGWCGTSITISYNGVQKQATIVDLCPYSGGCSASDGAALDLSQSLFESFTSLGAGVFEMEWWVTGSGSGSSGDDAAAASSSSAAAAAAAQSSRDAAAAQSSREAASWAAAQAASSSSAAAAAWASQQAASSSRAAAAAWASQQAASSSSEAAARAAASSAAHESWLSYNSVMSTSWDAVLSASRASAASVQSRASVQSQASARSEASADRVESRASVASVRSARSASRASRAAASSEGVSSSGKARKANTDDDADDNASNSYSPDTDNIPDSGLKAINNVAIRLASMAVQLVDDSQ